MLPSRPPRGARYGAFDAAGAVEARVSWIGDWTLATVIRHARDQIVEPGVMPENFVPGNPAHRRSAGVHGAIARGGDGDGGTAVDRGQQTVSRVGAPSSCSC